MMTDIKEQDNPSDFSHGTVGSYAGSKFEEEVQLKKTADSYIAANQEKLKEYGITGTIGLEALFGPASSTIPYLGEYQADPSFDIHSKKTTDKYVIPLHTKAQQDMFYNYDPASEQEAAAVSVYLQGKNKLHEEIISLGASGTVAEMGSFLLDPLNYLGGEGIPLVKHGASLVFPSKRLLYGSLVGSASAVPLMLPSYTVNPNITLDDVMATAALGGAIGLAGGAIGALQRGISKTGGKINLSGSRYANREAQQQNTEAAKASKTKGRTKSKTTKMTGMEVGPDNIRVATTEAESEVKTPNPRIVKYDPKAPNPEISTKANLTEMGYLAKLSSPTLKKDLNRIFVDERGGSGGEIQDQPAILTADYNNFAVGNEFKLGMIKAKTSLERKLGKRLSHEEMMTLYEEAHRSTLLREAAATPEHRLVQRTVSQLHKDAFQYAKDRGVGGTADLEHDPYYVMRIHSPAKARKHGAKVARSAYAEAIRKANPKLSDIEVSIEAERVIRGGSKLDVESGEGSLSHDMMEMDQETLDSLIKVLLKDNVIKTTGKTAGKAKPFAEMTPKQQQSTIKKISKIYKAENKKSSASRDAMFKYRIPMDLSAYDSQGIVRAVDLLEHDPISSSLSYMQRLHGWGAYAEKLNIKTPLAYANYKKQIFRELEGSNALDNGTRVRVEALLDSVFGINPYYRINSMTKKGIHGWQLYNDIISSIYLGRSGEASIPDFMGEMAGHWGMRAVSSHMKGIMQDTGYTSELIRGLDATGYYSQSDWNHDVFGHEESADGTAITTNKILRASNSLKRATRKLSAQQYADDMYRKMSGAIVMDNLLNGVMEGKGIDKAHSDMLLLTEKNSNDVARLLQKYAYKTEFISGRSGYAFDGKKYLKESTVKEQLIMDKLNLGLYRVAQRAQGKYSSGSRNMLLNNSYVKFFTAFQAIAINSYDRYIGSIIANGFNARHLFSILYGAMSALAMAKVRNIEETLGSKDESLGFDDPKLYLKAAAYVPYFGLGFVLTEKTLPIAAKIGGWDIPGISRYSTSPTDIWFQNPLINLGDNFVKGAANLIKEGHLTQQNFNNFKNLLPLHTWYPVISPLKMWSETLPK